MHGKNSFNKRLNRVNRRSVKKATITPGESTSIPSNTATDVGNWRITEDSDGSLILYNFETGNKIILARP